MLITKPLSHLRSSASAFASRDKTEFRAARSPGSAIREENAGDLATLISEPVGGLTVGRGVK